MTTQPTLFDALPLNEFTRLCDRAGIVYPPEAARAILLRLKEQAEARKQPSGWRDILGGLRKMQLPAFRAKLAATLDKCVFTVAGVDDVPF